jgi:hypothetical protein
MLEEWLDLIAELVATGETEVRERFWEVLSSGEMDVERAGVCVVWWGTRGGRERALGLSTAGEGERGRL